MPARKSAKLKTLVQSLAVGAVLLPLTTDCLWLGDGLLYVATFLAVFSAFQYVWDGSRAATTMETQVTDPA
jgi:CDP-diacylglycerol--glycerol-3-phosphate 3-phosphatidyltransferase